MADEEVVDAQEHQQRGRHRRRRRPQAYAEVQTRPQHQDHRRQTTQHIGGQRGQVLGTHLREEKTCLDSEQPEQQHAILA